MRERGSELAYASKITRVKKVSSSSCCFIAWPLIPWLRIIISITTTGVFFRFHCSSMNHSGQHLWEWGYVVSQQQRDYRASFSISLLCICYKDLSTTEKAAYTGEISMSEKAAGNQIKALISQCILYAFLSDRSLCLTNTKLTESSQHSYEIWRCYSYFTSISKYYVSHKEHQIQSYTGNSIPNCCLFWLKWLETGNELKSNELKSSNPLPTRWFFWTCLLYQTQTTEDIHGFLQTVC